MATVHVASIALIAWLATGCSLSWPWSGNGPRPSEEPAEPPPSVQTDDERDWRIDFVQTLLARGEGHLGSGALSEAEKAFEDALYWIGMGNPVPLAALESRAKWGLALTYLASGDPVRQNERTRALLQEIADEEGSPDSVLAGWIGGVLDEIQRLRGELGRQQELIRTLNATVEQLKQIDLTRRPAGSTPLDTPPTTGQPGPVP